MNDINGIHIINKVENKLQNVKTLIVMMVNGNAN